jgi:hypothetical protein
MSGREADLFSEVSSDLNPIRTGFQETQGASAPVGRTCHAIPSLLRRISRVVADFSAQERGNFFGHAAMFKCNWNPL